MEPQQDIRSVFGRVLRQYRREAGFSQEALAFECHLHRTFIGMLERGERRATIDTLFALTEALCVPPHEFVQTIEQELNL